MTQSRRVFLQHASAAAAFASMPWSSPRAWTVTSQHLLPEPDEAYLRELAQVAIDEARRAGATFADVRLSYVRGVEFEYSANTKGAPPRTGAPRVDLQGRLGVRAIVGGAWGASTGLLMTREGVAERARAAVTSARDNRPRRPRTLELAPIEMTDTGSWATPIERDPFTVPLNEQRDLLAAALDGIMDIPRVSRAEGKLQWRMNVWVFASTDGAALVQRFYTALPSIEVHIDPIDDDWRTRAVASPKTVRQGSLGYEAIAVPTLAQDTKEATLDAIERSKRIPKSRSVDVGRYEVVFGPAAVAALLCATLADAVDSMRALGYYANGLGTSFAAPPLDVLGSMRMASPAITVRGDRTQPKGGATVRWDGEGATSRSYTFVDRGVLSDYHTNRQTAMELSPWYRSRGVPVRSNACTRITPDAVPRIIVPNLTMEPGTAPVTVDAMIAGTKRGFYVMGCGGRADQQVINAQFGAPPLHVRKIVNGQLGDHVADFAFQFITQPFWKNITGIGDASTTHAANVVTDSSALSDLTVPLPFSTIRTVPIHARDVNVLNTGRTA